MLLGKWDRRLKRNVHAGHEVAGSIDTQGFGTMYM